MSRKIKVAFVLVDYSPAGFYNLAISNNVYDKVYAITLYSKYPNIDNEQLVFSPRIGYDFYEQLAIFVKNVAKGLGITDEYILLLPFNVEQRNRFNIVNRKLSKRGIRNEAPSKDMNDVAIIQYLKG